MPVNPVRTKRIAVNLPVELYADAEEMARLDRRTVSQWMRCAIEDQVKLQRRRRLEASADTPLT